MVSRRAFLAGSAGAASLHVAGRPRMGQPKLSDDGLYHEPWFLESLLELADDLDAAAAQSKRFAIMWELRGCPFCRETHRDQFRQAGDRRASSRRGSRSFSSTSSARARSSISTARSCRKSGSREKYGVRSTPTFQFFPERSAGLAARKPREREVARAQGYLVPAEFLAMFRFVAERAYERESLPDYLRPAASCAGP